MKPRRVGVSFDLPTTPSTYEFDGMPNRGCVRNVGCGSRKLSLSNGGRVIAIGLKQEVLVIPTFVLHERMLVATEMNGSILNEFDLSSICVCKCEVENPREVEFSPGGRFLLVRTDSKVIVYRFVREKEDTKVDVCKEFSGTFVYASWSPCGTLLGLLDGHLKFRVVPFFVLKNSSKRKFGKEYCFRWKVYDFSFSPRNKPGMPQHVLVGLKGSIGVFRLNFGQDRFEKVQLYSFPSYGDYGVKDVKFVNDDTFVFSLNTKFPGDVEKKYRPCVFRCDEEEDMTCKMFHIPRKSSTIENSDHFVHFFNLEDWDTILLCDNNSTEVTILEDFEEGYSSMNDDNNLLQNHVCLGFAVDLTLRVPFFNDNRAPACPIVYVLLAKNKKVKRKKKKKGKKKKKKKSQQNGVLKGFRVKNYTYHKDVDVTEIRPYEGFERFQNDREKEIYSRQEKKLEKILEVEWKRIEKLKNEERLKKLFGNEENDGECENVAIALGVLALFVVVFLWIVVYF